MEHTRENIIKSLRACSSPSESACTRCLYGDFEEGCRDQLRLAAAAMLEEIGKGELPRKPVQIESLQKCYARAQGRADVFSKALNVPLSPPHGFEPVTDEEVEEELTYFEAVIDAAITVLELRAEAGK